MISITTRDLSVDFTVNSNETEADVQAKGSRFNLRRAGRQTYTALSEINLDLHHGDKLGIIGHNGAGKSTLLRVLSGILPPTRGYIRVEGRVSPLISINQGMDKEVSGIENIRSRAYFMGRSTAEIAEKIPEIVDFCELDEFIHLPTKTYSSGMRLRLAFAIATAFQPDILVLDEWLSAGDEAFQYKASQRMNEVVAKSKLLVFASHNRALLKKVCNIAIVLDKGVISFQGGVEEALAHYTEISETTNT